MSKLQLNEIIHDLLGHTSPEQLIPAAGKYLRSPLILGDLSLHILGLTPDDRIEDPRWHSLCAEGTIPMNIVNLALYRSSLLSAAPVLSSDATGLTIVRCAVAQEGKLIGYLLSPCYYGAPTQEELDLIQVLADICSLRMQKDLHYAEYPEDMMAYFVSDLLNGTIQDEQKIRDRCRYFGWHLSTPYRVLTIRGQNPAEMEFGGGYLTLSEHCELLQERFPRATAFLYGEQIKLIIGVQDESVQEQLILQELSETLEGFGLVAGVSQPGWNLRSLFTRHQQAMKAIQMGTLLLGAGPLFYYDRYSVYHALELCSGGMDLRTLCHTAVLTLERYDRKNGTTYLGTLHAYLANGMNVSEAAKVLFIHRNTLAKRLERISDLITVDLTDRETVFHILFSLRAIEYYGATQMRSSFESWLSKMPTLRHT